MIAVPWGAAFPAEWSRTRVKHVCHFAGGGTPDKANAAYWDGNIPWVSPKDMKTAMIDDTEDHITVEGLENSATKIVAPGAVLLVMRSGILRHSLPVAINRVPVALNQDMRALTPRPEIEARFLSRLLEGHQQQLLNAWSKVGSTVESLESDLVGETEIALPPLPQQRSIADFLDRETAKIDALVEKKERLIGLLQEKRTALITQAVTKGLDPDAPMEDSGIEWLGQIPAHWGARRLKYLIVEPLKYGANEAAILEDPDLPRYVRITDIDDADALRDETFRSLPADVAAPYLLEEGDLLLARSGATAGKTFLYQESWGACAYAGYLIRARLDRAQIRPRFVRYFTASTSYWQWLSSAFIQATIQNVSAEKYAGLQIPVPPLAEQDGILAEVDRETRRTDALAAKVQEAIERLKEYRTALISAAVTGKIDVRA